MSAIARKAGGGGHRQAAGFSSEDSIEEIVEFIRREFVASTGGAGCGGCRRGRVGRSASSLARQAGRARRRSRSSPSCAAARGARTGHAGTLDPFATGLLVLLSGAATRLAPCFVGLDKRYVTEST